MQESLNNLLVDSLRSGDRKAVRGLISFGVSPQLRLDKVEGDNVASRSVWAWAHQAPSDQASQECWQGWLERKISHANKQEAQGIISTLMDEAISSAFAAGKSVPLVSSWTTIEAFCQAQGLPWSHTQLLDLLSHHLVNLPFRAEPVLEGLFQARVLSREDLLAWGEKSPGPWERVARRGLDGVLGWMLAAAHPMPSDLMERLERAVWSRLEESLSHGPEADRHELFSVRLFSCLNALAQAGHLSPLSRTPKDLKEAIARVESDTLAWPAEIVAALTQWKMARSLPQAPSPTSARSARL